MCKHLHKVITWVDGKEMGKCLHCPHVEELKPVKGKFGDLYLRRVG